MTSMKVFEAKIREGRETAPNSEAKRTMASSAQLGAVVKREEEEA